VASNKQQINWEEVEGTTGNLENGHMDIEQLLSGYRVVHSIKPSSLSRDRRVKMEQTNTKKQQKELSFDMELSFRLVPNLPPDIAVKKSIKFELIPILHCS